MVVRNGLLDFHVYCCIDQNVSNCEDTVHVYPHDLLKAF